MDENFRLLLRRQSVTTAESVQSYGRYGQSAVGTVYKVDTVRAVRYTLSLYISRLSMTVRVNVVLNRTVVEP